MSDLTRIFSLDPILCTRDDLTFLVQDFRSKRHLFNQGVMMAGGTKPSKEPSDVTEAKSKLNLKSLGL